MSAVSIAVRAFRRLESEDFRLLEAIEQQMKNYEFAPIDAIQNQSGLSVSDEVIIEGQHFLKDGEPVLEVKR